VNRVRLAVGVACVAAGVALTVGVEAPAIPGGTYGFVAVGSTAAIVAGVALYRDGRTATGTSVTAPPTQARPQRPGEAVADAIDDLRVVGRRQDATDGRRQVSERLESLAVDVLVAKRDVTAATARDRLESGAWTDDPAAAAFFVDGPVPPLTVRDQVAALRSGDPPFARRARHVLAELHRLEGDA
jgi:hypothetical protein